MPKAPIASCMMVAPVCMCMCVCVCARLRAREQALVRASACEFKQTHTSWGNAVFARAMQVDAHTEAKACDHKALKHRSGTHTHSKHSNTAQAHTHIRHIRHTHTERYGDAQGAWERLRHTGHSTRHTHTHSHAHSTGAKLRRTWHRKADTAAHWRTLAHTGAHLRTLAHTGAHWRRELRSHERSAETRKGFRSAETRKGFGV